MTGMIRIAITAAAFEAIAATLPFGLLASSVSLPSMASAGYGLSASGASVRQVDCLVRADIDIGHIR